MTYIKTDIKSKMKALMNSIVVAVGTIFFIMFATSLLLAQLGEAAGDKEKEKAQNLDYLREMDMNFYRTIVVPMAKECANVNVDMDTSAGPLNEKKKNQFCEVENLAKKLNELHQNHTKKKATTKQAVKLEAIAQNIEAKGYTTPFIQINDLRTQIHKLVFADLISSKRHYNLPEKVCMHVALFRRGIVVHSTRVSCPSPKPDRLIGNSLIFPP
jgi:hypothetical protein